MKEHIDWGFNELKLPQIKKKFELTGKGIKICVIDSGLDPKSQYLYGNRLVHTINLRRRTAVTCDSSDDLHGTEIAAIIGANTGDMMTSGIASEASMYIVQVVKASKHSLEAGLRWAIDHDVDLINISQQYNYCSSQMHLLIVEAARKGIVVVCSSGNGGGDAMGNITYPAAYQETISVSAVEKINGRLKLLPENSSGVLIDFVAPGGNIRGLFNGRRYRRTSFATPYVTGVIALMIEYCYQYSPKDLTRIISIKKALMDSVDRAGGIGDPAPMMSPQYGFGFIAPYNLFGHTLGCGIAS